MHYTPLRCQYYILVDVAKHTRKPESSRSHPLTSMKQMTQSRNLRVLSPHHLNTFIIRSLKLEVVIQEHKMIPSTF
jgi:hypothetical protein